MVIIKISKSTAQQIIGEGKPKGKFYMQDGENFFVGIDNSTGGCLVKDFKTYEECKKWLLWGEVSEEEIWGDNMILDSGAREEFETGAVRDIQEGKGRLDLLPLGIIAKRFENTDHKQVLNDINRYMFSGDLEYLWGALEVVNRKGFIGMLLDVSIHYEQGLKKYGERNWEKGIPLHCYMNSAIRHYLKLLREDTDEDHLKAFNWNILNAIHTHTYLPDMIDLPFNKKEDK